MDESEIIVPFTRVLSDDCRKLKYRKRGNEFRKPLHWGQRKLLMMEIEFLTMYGDRSQTVVYIGAADGRHILYLSKLFPKHSFILYDPVKFDPFLYDVNQIEIRQQFFTDEDAEYYKDKNVLMISDIRNMPEGYVARNDTDEINDDIEANVKTDMEMQKKWFIMMKPVAALLKFRLSYLPGKTEYLSGELRFQPWAPATSTETRLIVLPEQVFRENEIITKTYDNEEYESIMHRFNLLTRVQEFEEFASISTDDTGIFKSYDILAEIQILTEYIMQNRLYKLIKTGSSGKSWALAHYEYNTSQKITDVPETETGTGVNLKMDAVLEMIEEIHQHLGKDFFTKYTEKKIYFNMKKKPESKAQPKRSEYGKPIPQTAWHKYNVDKTMEREIKKPERVKEREIKKPEREREREIEWKSAPAPKENWANKNIIEDDQW